MEYLEGFNVKGKEELVCKSKKSLYRLKQTPRQWYKNFDSFIENHVFSKTICTHCFFVKKFGDNDFIILLLYVDDILIVGQDTSKINELKRELSKYFAMKDLGLAKHILSIKISRDKKSGKLWLSQEAYNERFLERFNMSNAKSVCSPPRGDFNLSFEHYPTSEKEKKNMKGVPYASAVGSLIYDMVCTRPDIAHVVSVVSQFLSNPGKEHKIVVKWILRYLKGTSKAC